MFTDMKMMLLQPVILLALAVVILPGVVRVMAAGADWLEYRLEHNDRYRNIFHKLG